MSLKSTFLIFAALIFALPMPLLAQETTSQETVSTQQDNGMGENVAILDDFANCAASVKLFSESNNILFAPASAKLTGSSADALKDLADILEKCPDGSLYVSGHTDSDGPEAANMALSVARAEAVNAELVSLGIKDTRLYALGYGETMPIASNNTRAGKAQNRRIVFELKKQSREEK